MSSQRSTHRSTPSSRRLFLIRGGLDPQPDLPDRNVDDWQGFCERVGWASGAEPDADFEARIAARLVGALPRADVDGACEAKPAAAEPARAQWGWRVRSFSLGAAAAALLMVGGNAFSSRSRGAPVSGAVPASRAVLDAATAATRDLTPPVDSSLVHCVREPKDRSSKSPEPRRPNQDHPGGLVASMRSQGQVRRTRTGPPGSAAPSSAPAHESVAFRGLERADFDEPSGSQPNATSSALMPRHSTGQVAEATFVAMDTRGADSNVFADAARWAFAPEGDRFFGASVAPSPAAGTAPGGIGVVAELDVGRALSRL